MSGRKELRQRRADGVPPHPPIAWPEPDVWQRKPPDEAAEFAIGLYRHLARAPGNLCFSPFSVSVALGMTLAGARGPTADELRSAMCLPAAGEWLPGLAIARLSASRSGDYGVTIANGMWSQRNAPVLADYRELVEGRYHAKSEAADFARSPEAARAAINAWVGEATRGRIRDLIGRGVLTTDSRLVLINALCFLGSWEVPFPAEQTRDEDFHVERGVVTRVPMMRQVADVSFARRDGFRAVELDYRDPAASMLILLPEASDGLRDLEEELSAGLLRDCVAALVVREVELDVPRFRLHRGTADLVPALRALGVEHAFDRDRADLSGINGRVPPDPDALFVSSVLHQAFVDVNEKGTEASAATAGIMTLGCLPPPNPPPRPAFRADHPFLFAIRERASGTILFLGRVNDPGERG